MKKFIWAAFVFNFVILAPVGFSLTVNKTFQDGTNGYTGTTDTYINRLSPDAVPTGSGLQRININFGAAEHTEGLLRFDLSSIPTNATIDSASLVMTETRITTQDSSDIIIIDKVTSSWTESTTWNTRPTRTSTSITTPDISGIASGTTNTYTITGMGSLVQEWVTTPASNFGVQISETNNAVNFRLQSREDPTVSYRPALQVTYTIPDPILTSITVTPASDTAPVSATRQYTATALDQNGMAMSPQPAITWSVTGASNSINSSGLLTIGSTTGNFTVTAANGAINGTASITVVAGGSVVLQQGVSSYTGTDDTFLDQMVPATAVGGSSSLNLGYATNAAGAVTENEIALTRFDVSSIPSNATVTAATLTFTTTSKARLGATDVVSMGIVSSSWTENHTYSMGIPTHTASGIVLPSVAALTNGAPYAISGLTNIVQNWVGTPSGNNGLIFQTTSDMFVRFATSEHTITNSRPALAIEYILPTPVTTTINVTPSSVYVGIGLTQAFTATALDQFGAPMSPQPTFTWSVTGGGSINSSGVFTATTQGSFTATASAAGKNGTANFNVATLITLQEGVSGYAGTQDAYVDQISTAANAGGAQSLAVRNRTTTPNESRQTLIKFDLSTTSIPVGATIVSANLVLNVTKAGDLDATDTILLDQVTATWDEGTVTGSSTPSSTASGITLPSITSLTVGSTYTIPGLQSLVQGWFDTPANNFGLKIHTSSSTPALNLSFASSENTTSPKPILQIYYTVLGGGGDSDSDTLPDSWELFYFPDLNQTAGGDYDGDGQTNYQEYLAGTSPKNTASRLVVASQTFPTVDTFTITWPSLSTKTYTIEFSDDMATWSTATSVPGAAAASTTSWTDDGSFTSGDPLSLIGKRFYRVKLP